MMGCCHGWKSIHEVEAGCGRGTRGERLRIIVHLSQPLEIN